MANEVDLTFTGDEDDLTRSMSKVGSAADAMSGEVTRSGRKMGDAAAGFDRFGDAADNVDTKAMGFRDTLTGVQDTAVGFGQIMEGDLFTGFLTLGMGIGDLASGVANLGAPMLKTASTWVTGHATMAVASVSSAAAQVGAWISVAATSLVSAAQVALAWLISIGPLILVGAAVIGLVVLIVKNWDRIKAVIQAGWAFVSRISASVWRGIKATVGFIIGAMVSTITTQINVVKAIFRGMVSGIKFIISGLAQAIIAPFLTGFRGIKSAWNNTVGGKGFDVPSWIPGIGGKSFRIPFLAQGGVVSSPTLALIGENGPEKVTPLGPGDRGGTTTLLIKSGGSKMDDLIVEIIRRADQTGVLVRAA